MGRTRGHLRGIRPQLYIVQVISLVISMAVGLILAGEIQRSSMQQINLQADASFNQTVQSLDSMLDSMITTTHSFAYTHLAQQLLHMRGQVLDIRDLYNSVMSNVRFIINTNPNVVDIALIDTDGKIYLFGEQIDHILAAYAMDYVSGLDETAWKEGVFTGFLSEEVYRNRDSIVLIYPVYSSLQGEEYGKRAGTCLMLCRTSSLTNTMSASLFGNNALTLRKEDGDLMVQMGGTFDAKTHRLISHNVYTLPATKWVFEQSVYEDVGQNTRRVYQSAIIVFMITAIFIILTIIVLVQRNISTPIVQINRQLQRIATEPESGGRIQVSTRNELSTIADNINLMLDELHTQYDRNIDNQRHILEVELSKKRLQLSALQSQINPHFLYNTLACIRGMALEHRLPDIASIASNMASIFRYSIKGDTFVLFRDEIAITKKYLDIMNLRMDNRFSVNIDVPQEMMDTWIVKMMLQPLVENAVFHGIECREGEGRLDICVEYLDAGRYMLKIRDNGVGIAPDALHILNHSLAQTDADSTVEPSYKAMGIGMANINQKIKLLVGKEYGLRIESEQGVFTVVQVTMPFLPQYPRE